MTLMRSESARPTHYESDRRSNSPSRDAAPAISDANTAMN
jgi:hypothetical protein